MITTTNGCACHGTLGIGPTAVSDAVLQKVVEQGRLDDGMVVAVIQ